MLISFLYQQVRLLASKFRAKIDLLLSKHHCILYIKMLGFFCLFVCLSELIEELASRRDTKIGM